MEENNMKQAMTNWLSEEIKKYCNADGMIETYWDYQDREALNDEVKRYAADFEGGDLIEHIADNMRDENWYLNWCDEYEDDFFAGIRNDAPTIEDEELRNYVVDRLENMDYTDLRDELEVAGYNGVDDGIESELKDVKVNVNLTLATDNEANYDMSSIITCFGTDYLPIEFDSLDASHLDNALTYLIHQQGHTLKEYYDSYLGNADGGKLLKSIGTEVDNNPAEATCGLTVLVSIGLGEYSAIISKEGSIEVSADTELGLYNSWIGGGSVFEISLEKPFVFPASMVLHADLDDVTGTGAYSVGDTYGTMGDDRTGTIKKGGEVSVVDEDLEAVADYVRATYDNGEEVEESKKVTESLRQDTKDAIDLAINEIDNGNSDDPDWFNKRYNTYDKLVQGVLDLIGVNIKYGSSAGKEPTSAVNFSGKEAIINEIKRQLAEWGYKESDFRKKTEDIANMGDLRDSIDTENLIEDEDEFELVVDSDVGDLEDIKTASEDELYAGGELASLYCKNKDNDIVVVLEYDDGFWVTSYHWDENAIHPVTIESIEIALTPETTEDDIKKIMIDLYKRALDE